MRIGILTQPLHTNYGGLLQNYALQQTLIRAGHEVETIDWNSCGNGIHKKLYYAIGRILRSFLHDIYPRIRYKPNGKERAIILRNTAHFINTYINHTEAMHSYEEFAKQASKGNYDAYVVGSDQCWRPCYNSFLTSMFLDFVHDKPVKRIAYAASFGTNKWEFTPHQTDICAPLAQNFDLVTVREDSGVKLCREHLGVDAIQVLDPTMLLTKEEYIQLIEKEKEPKSNGTLFNYILDPDENKSALIKKAAKAKGLKDFQVLPKYLPEMRTKKDVKNRIEDCVFPNVTTWLRAFMDAEMVIVDSFHGIVFSIIFNKPFWAIGNVSRGMSRFTSLLKLFHLEDRLLDAGHLDDVEFSKPIDWTIVNGILEEKRRESKDILLNLLKK